MSDLLEGVQREAQAIRKGYTPQQSGLLSAVDQEAQAIRQAEERKRAFMYGIPMSDSDYEIISTGIASSPNPDEERWNWGAALMYSQRLGVDVATAKQNLEGISSAWLANPMNYKGKSHFEAIVDSFRAGDIQMEAADIAKQWRDGGGADTGLQRKLDELYGEMEKLQDHWPRNIAVEILKAGAQTAPFMVQTIGSGAMAAGAATLAIGALGGTAATAGIGAPVGAAATAAALKAFAFSAGSFMTSFSKMSALEYYEMRRQGISHDVANTWATISGGAQAMIETSLGNVPGLIGKVGGETVTSISGKIAKKLFLSGKWGAAARAIMSYGGEVFEEGVEEALQSIVSDVSKNIAADLEDKGIPQTEAADIAKNAVEQFKGGALAAVGMGLPGAFIGYKQAAKQSKALTELASAMDKDDFIYEASKWEGVADMPEKARKEALGDLWERQQKRKAQEAEEGPKATTEADVEVEEDGTEPTDVRKTKEGTIRTELGEQRTNADGSTTAIVKAGEPDAPGRYGYARYTIDGDTVRIDSVKVKESIKDKAEVRRALVLEIAAQNPGLDIQWDTKSDENQAVKDRLSKENPRGVNAGLQWYGADEKPQETKARHKFRADILSSFKAVSTEQADAITALAERRAARVGLSLEEYRNKYISGITTETPEGVLAAQKAGKRVLGATVIRDGKALVYAAKNADFSTLAHEFMHVWENETRETGGEDLVTLEKAFNIEHGKWTDADRERVAYTWEEFLRTGKAKTPELQNIFQRIAEWMVNIYRKISGKIAVSDEIADALEGLFSDPASPLSEAARTKAQEVADLEVVLFQETPKGIENENKLLSTDDIMELQDNGYKDNLFIRWSRGPRYDNNSSKDYASGIIHAGLSAVKIGYWEKDYLIKRLKEYEFLRIKDPNIAPYIYTGDIVGTDSDGYQSIDNVVCLGRWLQESTSMTQNNLQDGQNTTVFQYAGENAILDEIEKQNLSVAKEMDAAGKDAETIRLATGWFKGKYDGKWRIETDDQQTSLIGEWPLNFEGFKNLGDVFYSPKIYAKYPSLKKVAFAIDNNMAASGEYVHSGPVRYIYFNNKKFENAWSARQTMIHEVQHIIQDMEGFAKGSNPDQFKPSDTNIQEYRVFRDASTLYAMRTATGSIDKAVERFKQRIKRDPEPGAITALDQYSREEIRQFVDMYTPKSSMDQYWNTGGEVESRDVAERMGLSPKQRRAIPPYSSENIAAEDAVVLFQVQDRGYSVDPKQATDDDFISEQEFDKIINGHYYANKDISSRTTPAGEYNLKAGTWVVGDYKLLDGHPMGQLRLMDVNDIKPTEDMVPTNTQGRGWDSERYAEWIKEGKTPPPITVLEMEDGGYTVTDGHRRYYAARATTGKVWAWVWPIMDNPRIPGQKTAMTYEAMTGKEWTRASTTLFQEIDTAFTSALDKFGETKNIYEAGYVLPDGRMIDLSGRNQATGYTKKNGKYVPEKDDYLKNQRGVDHREIEWDSPGMEDMDGNERMEAFIGMGAIRIDANSGLADMSAPPTPKQWAVIKTIIESSGTAWVEMRDGKRTASIEADGKPAKALGFIRRFYEGENFEETIVFQSEDALRAEAGTFDTWREFMEYVEATDSQEDKAVESLPQDEREKWYRDFWKAAQAEKQKPLSPEEADSRFVSKIETEEGLDEFLSAVNDIMTDTFDEPPQDAEEQAFFEKRMDLQRRARAMHPTVLNNATRVGMGRPITERARASIETLMKAGATHYRRLYAEIMDDATLQNVDKEAEATVIPKIEDPDESRDWEAMSIVQRMKVAKSIKNAEIKKRLMSGEIVPEKEMQDIIVEQDAKIAELEADVKAKEKEIADDFRMFSTHEKTFVEQKARIKELSDDLAKTERTISRLVERGQAVGEALTSARQEAALQLKNAKAQLAAVRATERTKAREAKEQAIAEVRTKIKEAQQKRDDAKKVIQLKKSIANQIMRPLTTAISYDKRLQIEALQSILDPHFRRAKIKWRGEMYDLDELRNNTQFLQDAALEKKLINRLNKKPLNEWTIEELEKLNDEIQRLRDQGIQEWAAIIQERKAAAIRSASAIASEAFKSGKYEQPAVAGSEERAKQIKKKNSLWRQIQTKTLNAARIANLLDGGKDGENTKILIAQSREAYAEKMNNLDRRAAPIIEALKKAGYKGNNIAELARPLWERKYTLQGVGPERSAATLTADDLMYIAIALKDEHARAAILYGNFASEQERLNQDEMALKSWGQTKEGILRDAIAKYLTPADMEILNVIQADYTNEFGRLNNRFIEEFNVAMKQVGFYVPLVRETTASMDTAHEKQQAEEVLNVGGITVRRNPDKGFTHERVNIKPKNQRAVKLGLVATWLTAVEREEHFHAYTPYIRHLNRVYKSNSAHSRQVRDAIVNTYGTEAFKYIENYINEQANPKSFADAGLNRLVRGLRGDLGSAYLGWKLSGVVKQLITSPIPYSAYVSPLAMIRSAFTYASNPKAFDDFIKERSAIMRHRVQNPIIQVIKEGLADPKTKQKFAQFKEIGIKGLEIADWVSVATGWRAAYDSAIAKGQTDKEASAYADDVTLKCQPSARPEDMAPLFKTGSEFTRAFTQFQSALNVIWNQVSYDIPVAIKNKQFGYAFRQIASYIVAGILLGLVTRGKEDDDETKADDFLYWSMTQFTDSVPLIGSQVNSLWRQVATGEKSTPYSSPLMPALDESIAALRDISEGDWGNAARNFSEGVGLFLGAPVSGIKEIVKTAEEGPGALVGRRRK